MASVALRTPRGPMFVGSYVKVPLRIDPASGLTLDDLEFEVDGGPPGGIVSLSRDEGFDPRRPSVLLCAGFEPGSYLLRALEKATGNVAGEAKFSVDSLWTRDDLGPSHWFAGSNELRAAGGAWGGGPAGPQNMSVSPQSGTWRIAILFVDTSSQRYTTDAPTMQGHRDRWMNETVNGVVAGGVTRSVAHFYREVSYGILDVTAQAFGPVSLPGDFDSYFNTDRSPKGGFYQACFTAGDNLIDYRNFDTLLCVSQSVPASGTTPMKSAWPYASIGRWGPWTTADGNLNRGVISMPNEWGTTSDREIYDTLSHELGHNLGLGDQYTPGVTGRNVGGWDMMHADDPLPHFSLVHRMMLGWIQAGWLRTFNFSAQGAAVDQTIELHPVEQGAPPSGRSTGVEVRLADGWNYYFEYRRGQAAQIGDRALPTDDRVLGLDAVSPPWTAPILRPSELLLNNDIDGDGAVLGNGQDYEERDSSDPMFPTDFTADVSGIDGTKANLRIRYGVNTRPDPSIRPWPAGPGREWQSPDIEVRNARNAADSTWFNVPWEANPNTIVAKVKNNSTAQAPQVRVNFAVKNYNVGGTPETFLGSDVRDIGPGQTVEFSTSWTPPSQGHFCVVARIPLYQVPTALSVVELTELNNLAQSNYDRFISKTSSPATREVTSVEIGNPYAIPARIFLIGNQSNPIYRTFIEHQWVVLNPGETRQVRVMFEYAPTGDKRADDAAGLRQPDIQEFERIPNEVGVHAVVEDPRDVPAHALQVLGGAQVQVVKGRGTRFDDVKPEGGVLTGRVVAIDEKRPFPRGQLILTFSIGRGEKREVFNEPAKLGRGGTFKAALPDRWDSASVYFLPEEGFGDCTSEAITNPG